MTADLHALVGAVHEILGDERRDLALDEAACGWTGADWRELLLDIPPDSGTFTARLELPWDTVISSLGNWRRRFGRRDREDRRERASLNGRVGLLLLTLVSLRHSERRRSPWADGEPDHDCAALCAGLVRDADVQDALREVYAPDDPDAEWETIDFRSLVFHRHGTTSFLLTGNPLHRREGTLKPFALKCILQPFLRIPTIGRATRSYARTYELPGTGAEHLVRVWSSGGSWLLMDFVEGPTLAELLAESTLRRGGTLPGVFDPGRAAAGARRLDLERLRTIGAELFRALADLDACELEHGDLSPSNIIVVTSNDCRHELRLVDLGVNYLYLHNLPGRDGADAAYVAPEIRALGRQVDPGAAVEKRQRDADRPSDLYSLGQLLTLLGCGRLEPDGTVPDVFYAEAPLLARFIEDLTDRDPDRRLLIFEPDGGNTYESLRQDFEEELDAVFAAKAEGTDPHSATWWRGFVELFAPMSGALGRQYRLWRKRRSQNLYRDPRRSFGVRRLLAWSTVATLSWGLCSVLVLMWTYRNAGLPWDNQLVFALQRLTGASPGEFPFIDQLRADDYEVPPELNPVALGVLALTFTLVGVKYYQSLFASVTPLAIGWRSDSLSLHGVAAEVAMRTPTFLMTLMTLTGILVQPRWWLLLIALGMTVVTVVNALCSTFASTALRQARERGLSTVPATVPGVRLFTSWIPGNVMYTLVLWAVGVLLYVGVIHDAMLYLVVITFLNVVQLYVVKCGIQGPVIRAGLARSSITAERLRLVS